MLDDPVALHNEGLNAPKYQSIHEALVIIIEGLPAGSAMPTERELCQTYGVSRATIRQALAQLEIEQRIYRRQGKGTFVAKAKIEQRLELMSHTEGMRARGISPGSKLIDVRRINAGSEIGVHLNLDATSEVLRIERLRLADGEPIAIEVVYLSAERFDGITSELSDSASLYQLLFSNYGIELASAEETIEAVVAEGREIGLLRCTPGMPLLMMSRRTLDTTGQPIEFVRSLYRGDRYRFQTGLRRPAPTTRENEIENLSVRVRLAVAEDAPAMATTFIEAWRGGYRGVVDDDVIDAWRHEATTAWLGDLVADKSAQTLVAELSPGKALGFVRFGVDPDDASLGHIFALYVAPKAAGRGIGSLLLEKALTVLDPLASRDVTLWVFEANERARALYTRAGFAPDGGRRVEEEFKAQEIRLRRRALGRSKVVAS